MAKKEESINKRGSLVLFSALLILIPSYIAYGNFSTLTGHASAGERLFNVDVKIPEKYKELKPNDEVIAEITVENLMDTGLVDVLITYKLNRCDDAVFYEEKETKAVERRITYVKKITIPSGIPPPI